MDKTIYKSKNVLDEQGNKVTLFYYLLSKQTKEHDKDSDVVYGIEITKYKDEIFIESDKIEGISYKKNEVLDFITDIANGNVTPISLVELTDEFISQTI